MKSILRAGSYALILGLMPASAIVAIAQNASDKPVTPAAAAPAPVTPPVLTVIERALIRYPSLEPMDTIHVSLNSPTLIFDAVNQAVNNKHWNCLSPASYKIEIVDTPPRNPPRVVEFRDIVPDGIDLRTGKLFTSCDGAGDPGGVSLFLNSRVKNTDLVQVTLYYSNNGKPEILAQSDGKLKLTSSNQFTSSGTLQSAPGEALTNGKSRDVGQMTLALAETDLFHNSPVNFYAKSTDLFSTDEKDSKSAFLAAFGAQRDLFPKVYSPVQLEERIQGNQTATNLSAVTSLSASLLTPWSKSAPVFNNQAISAPLAPSLALGGLYTHRFHQLVTAKSPLLSVDDFSLNPSLSWSSITVPVSCKVFGWLGKIGKPTPPAGAAAASPAQYCMGSTIDLGAWYLPLDLTRAKSQRFEGYGDASILLPLAGFGVFSRLFPYLASSDPAKTQIQIKYSDSVNAANNYARARGWTFGFQALK
ncbi:MAG: hypothetical protein WCA89_09560 [Terracidiphilus sp.]|jgi:hypothetical protein